MEENSLFGNLKFCSFCHRPLPLDYEKDLCPGCEENELFSRVKEFIRSRDVTEYDVVEEFNIPIRQVKNWIKEGRIEYKDMKHNAIQVMNCIICGESIKFGSYCQKCFKIKNTPKATHLVKKHDDKMRFLE